MIRISKKRVVLVMLAVGVIIILGWQLSMMVSASPLTENEARKLVKEMYGGEIETVKKANNSFYVTLQSENGQFNVTVDQKSGEILKVEKKKEHQKKENQLTATDIKRLIQQDYPGKIEQLEKKLEGDEYFYFAVVRKDAVETQLKINPLSGKILESSKKVDTKEDSTHGITEQEARKIALKKINGVVDDVDIEVSDGLSFYLVEVERDKEKEAIVQINAITGEVLSITWDD